MKNMKKAVSIVLMLAMCLSLVACGNGAAEEETVDISSQELLVFSGAGLANPVQEIADAFEAETGCKPQIVFAATGQLISQIQTSESGDILIAGAKDELAAMTEDEMVETVEMVKHIPVIAVKAGNPLGIDSFADLAAEDVTIVFPDPETTPMGKIAMKVFEEAGIKDRIDVVANTTTAPLAMTALAEDQADAAVLWKENVATNDKVEALELPEMEKYVKVVPAVSLSYSENNEAREAFLEFMTSDAGMEIWAKHGYEAVE